MEPSLNQKVRQRQNMNIYESPHMTNLKLKAFFYVTFKTTHYSLEQSTKVTCIRRTIVADNSLLRQVSFDFGFYPLTCFSTRAESTKFVPLSERITHGCFHLFIKVRNAIYWLSKFSDGAPSWPCSQISRHKSSFIWNQILCLNTYYGDTRSIGRSVIFGATVCPLTHLTITRQNGNSDLVGFYFQLAIFSSFSNPKHIKGP